MKKISFAFISLFFIAESTLAQDCILKDTLLKIDFGTAARPQDFNLTRLNEYRRITGTCPDDGMYSFVSSTSACYSDHWHTLFEDHTPGDNDGNMMLINASYEPGIFFYTNLAGLKPNKKYELSTWILNICKPNNDCTATLPDITIVLETLEGVQIAKFNTGSIAQTNSGQWKRYFSNFTTPGNTNVVALKFFTNSPGGCGNDFAIDDITFRECYPPEPVIVKQAPKPVPVVTKPVVKEIPKEKAPLKKSTATVSTLPVKDMVPQQPVQIKTNPVAISLPDPIRNRENPVIKKITSLPGELLIELYDNGTIDGDTVSIYLNNELIVSRAGLSEKPISIRVNISKNSPHQEITMVAENLGSIPPNTSLMIVTSKGKREEVFISSTRQKNARIVIDMKE